MRLILGVLIFGLLKWIFEQIKLCYKHIDLKIKILIIFPISALIITPWLIIQTLILNGYTELIIAIMIGSVGSHYILSNEEKNEI